jgi:CRP-like cAMP-binding protein
MSATVSSSKNRLLRSLSREDYRSLAPHLKQVSLSLDNVLVERNAANNYVYFPLAGLISVHTIFTDHVSLDMVGKEGMVGIFVAAGVKAPHARIAVQGSGSAMRVAAKQFRVLAHRSGSLQRHMHRYTCQLLQHSEQTSRCNGLHPVEARLARCLLETSDRGGSRELRVTHELLAAAMGARRTNVTVAANALRSRKLIDYTRGRLKIIDRPGLMEAACACYGAVAIQRENPGRKQTSPAGLSPRD